MARRWVLAVLVMWSMVLAGCGGGGSSDRVEALSLTASATTMSIDAQGYVWITASVLDGAGKVLPAADVVFRTTLGSLSSTTVRSDVNGQARTRLYAGSLAGTAQVSATVNGQHASVSVTFTSGQVASVGLFASPSTIAPNGLTTLTAMALDQFANPLVGQTLTFSLLTSQANPLATGGQLGAITAVTDANGQVSVPFTAGPGAGLDYVHVRSVTGLSAQVGVVVSSAATRLGDVTLTALNTIMPADGVSQTLVRAYVEDVNNAPLSGVVVSFSTTGGSLLATTAATGADGIAQVYLRAGDVAENAIVSASLGGVVRTVSVQIGNSNTQGSLVLTAANTNVPADGTTQTLLTAQVLDTNDQPLPGVLVQFATNKGSLTAASAVTDSAGNARSYLVSSTQVGVATVTAASGGFLRSVSVEMGSLTPPARLIVTAEPSVVRPNEVSNIQALALDAAGQPVANANLIFEITTNVSGGSLSGYSATTNAQGIATITYTAGSLVTDTYQLGVGWVPGYDTLTVNTTNSVSGGVPLRVTNQAVGVDDPHPSDMILVTGGTDVPADGSSRVLVAATVLNLAGQPIVGTPVTFSASLGTLDATTVNTDANGVARTQIFSGDAGLATITASAGGVVRTASVNFTGGSVSTVALTANPSSLVSGAVSSVVATVTDSGGRPIVGESLTFGFAANASGALFVSTPSATTGSSTQSATTDAFGRATVYYKAGSTSGSDTVEVISSNGVRQSVVITLAGSGATIGGLTLTSANASIPADGVTTVALTAQVQDTAGQPLANQSVAFASTAGTLSAATATTDATGMARVTLRAGTQATTAVVTASTGGFNATVSVQLVAGVPSAANSSITAQPASLPADGVSTSTVTVVLRDANNNPVANGTPVTLLTTAGTITSANPAATSLGRATFTLQAPAAPGSASLTLLEYPSVSAAAVTFGSVSTGDPANITVSVANPALFVTGVGKTDSTSMVVTVKDAAGALISDANAGVNNLVVTFRSKPNGGETISGTNAAGTVVTSSTSIAVRTSNGVATLTLQSGTLPGVVELEVEALSSAGAALVPAVKASLPQVSIASGPPHNIALSYPVAGVTNLGGGVYRRIGSASVTDRYGNAVPDGTVISLGLLDSVIASNTTPVLSGGAASDASTTTGSATLTEVDSTWTSASVTRNGVARSLQANDRVLLLNAVAGDKSRFLTAAPAANTSATVQKNYSTTAAGLEYVMGAALLGGQISGVDAQTGLTQTGRATTQNGVATLYVTYPADREHILTGCYGLASPANHTLDIRTGNAPAGSAQVWVVAESTESGATSLDNRFCFAAIGPYKLPSGAGGTISGTTTITFDVKDQNDIPLPFVQVSPSRAITTDTGAPLTVSFGNCSGRADQRTDEFGVCSMTITVGGADSGDAATISIGAGDATPISITLTVP